MPPPPLELVQARTAVDEVIEKELTTDEAARIAKHWHQQVKVWEETDTLDGAFSDCRLTFRYMIHPDTKYDYKKENPTKDPTRERLLGIVNNDRFQKPITNTGIRDSDGVWVLGGRRGGTIKLDGGGAGIVRRMDPENFMRTPEKPQSNKFGLGLHALSASLLDPDGYSAHRFSETALLVFMPLPFTKDVKIFYELRRLSKSGGSPTFQAAVVTIASQFTRPQFAAGMDMGAQYVVVKSARHGQDSVKYVRGTKNQDKPGQTPKAAWTNARNDYKEILKSKLGNEITIAYRRHGLSGTRFPIFAIGQPNSTDYAEVRITIPAQDPPRKFGSPPPRKNPFYEVTGRIIDGTDFSIRQTA